jgi:hypothetical protein
MNDDNMRFGYFLNELTGEIVEIYEGDSVRIIKSKQKKIIENKKYIKTLNDNMKLYNDFYGGFVFSMFKYHSLILDNFKDINESDITRLFYIATFVDYDGYLIFDENKVTKNNLKIKIKLTKSYFYQFFIKMSKNELLVEDDFGYIKVNKKYFYKGEIDKKIFKSYNYTRIYINTIRYLYENTNDNNCKYLGYLFKMIPYIHKETNILCWNPDCEYKDIDVILTGELPKLLNSHTNTIKKLINGLLKIKLKNNRTAISFIKNNVDDKNLPIIINKEIFYAGKFDLPEGQKYIDKWFEVKEMD